MPVTGYQETLAEKQRRFELRQANQRFIDAQELFRQISLRFDALIEWWNRTFPNDPFLSQSQSPSAPINQPERNIVEDTKSLKQIIDTNSYICPVTYKDFHEMNTPVMNRDGNVVEIDSPMVGRNLLNPEEEIGFTKSAALIKIQDDVKEIQTQYSNVLKKNDDMMLMLQRMTAKLDTVIEKNAEILEENKALKANNVVLNQKLDAMSKDNAELKASNVVLNQKLDAMGKNLDEQNKTIEAQAKEIVSLNAKLERKDREWELKLTDQAEKFEIGMNSVLAQMDNKDKEIASLKTIVYDQNDEIKRQGKEIVDLKEKCEESDKIIKKLSDHNDAFLEKVERLEDLTTALKADSDQFVPNNNHPLKQKLKVPKIVRSEESIGRKWNPSRGFVHTTTLGTDRKTSPFYDEMTEDAFRRHAYEGKFDKLKKRLEEDKDKLNSKDEGLRDSYRFRQFWLAKMDINGRGMPDAICSIVRGFKDKTALMLASQKGHFDCVKLLIEKEAEINYLDRDNFTALDYAQQNQHKEVADFLKGNGALNGVDVLHYLKNEGIQKKDGTHYDSENFDITVHDDVPAALRVIR